MILYLDASVIVKAYLTGEPGADAVAEFIERAAVVGTSVVTRAETSAALAKAVRMGILTYEEASRAVQAFREDWSDLARTPVSDLVATRADEIAFERGLRGYDAIHLASALVWQERLGEEITFGAYDRQLWGAAEKHALRLFPADLPAAIESWNADE